MSNYNGIGYFSTFARRMMYMTLRFFKNRWLVKLASILLVMTSCQSGEGPSSQLNELADTSVKVTEQRPNGITSFQVLVDSTVLWEFKDSIYPNWTEYEVPRDGELKSILTFRGGFQRGTPTIGTFGGHPDTINVAWQFSTAVDTLKGRYGYWGGGAGWTGQPLLVHWTTTECAALSGLYEEFQGRKKDLLELIQVSLSGRVYFIDLESGRETRPPILISNPIKGTPSIDPAKRYLMVGQGIPHRNGFHLRCFDLRNGELLMKEVIPSAFAYRKWGASDASPLFTEDGRFIWPTESGVVYFGEINATTPSALYQARYKFRNYSKLGTESSPAAIGNLMYFTDNGGGVVCVDFRTMQPRWNYQSGDDMDATPVVDIERSVPYVYVGNEVDKQGTHGMSTFTKLNGLTGEVVWTATKACNSSFGERPNNGGILSTACIGTGNLSSYVWTVFSKVDSSHSGRLVCYNKSNGSIHYEVPLSSYTWVSPLLIRDRSGNGYIYLSDVGGNVYVIEARTGNVVTKKNFGVTFESSPIAWNNRIVQPARGSRVFCFELQ
jgi:hypothetical protein